MKAVLIDRYKSLDAVRIVEKEKPAVKKGEVLVKVMAAAVNSGDERLRALNFEGLPMPQWLITPLMKLMIGIKGPRKTPGATLSGVIEEVGEGVDNFKPGDEIFAMAGFRFGAFAEYATLKADHCIALKPKKADFMQAAALPFGATTALYFLRKADIENAKKVLIYGSSGAVGIAAVQLAAHKGTEVTAVSGPDSQELNTKLGAAKTFDYKKTKIAELPDTYDIVLDAVGHTSKKECESVMNESASYISVIGFDSAKELSSDLEYIAKLYDEGKFTEVIDSTYDLEDVAKAFERVSTGHKQGNVILDLS